MVEQQNAIADTDGNLPLGILAGSAAALVGALIWMGVTVMTGIQIGYVALGIGALVGFAVRWAGKGSTPVFGVVGAVATLIGCIVGQALAEIELAANASSVGFFQVLSVVNVGELLSGVVTNSSPITYFIYAIGIYEGYKLSIVR
jgi:hypothetical protein